VKRHLAHSPNPSTLLRYLALLLLLLSVAPLAFAGLTFCNDGPIALHTAFAYYEKGSWKAAGWYTIQPGRCEWLMKGDLDSRYYYGYAESVQGSYTWGGDHYFCVSSQAFELPQNCPLGWQYRSVGFAEIDTGDADDFTWRLECTDCRYWDGNQLRMTLPEVTVSVPVAGSNTSVPLSGNAWVTRVWNQVDLVADVDVDLRHVVKRLRSVIRDQAEVDESCGDRIRLHRIDLVPHGRTANISVGGKYERWVCAGLLGRHRALRQGGSAELKITPTIRGDRVLVTVSLQSIHAEGLLGSLLETHYLGSYVRQQIANAMPGTVEVANLRRALPAEARYLQPRLESITFVDLGDTVAIRGRLHLTVTGEAGERLIASLSP